MSSFVINFAVYITLLLAFLTYPSFGPYLVIAGLFYTFDMINHITPNLETFSNNTSPRYFRPPLPGTLTSDPRPYGLHFAGLNDSLVYGNPQSFSDRQNQYLNWTFKGKEAPVISLGTPYPLPHEDFPTTPVEKSMFYFHNYASRPECCLSGSPYSNSTGCVCWTPPEENWTQPLQHSQISPSS